MQELQLTTNAGIKQLAAGPWQSSLTKLEADWGLADAALDAGVTSDEPTPPSRQLWAARLA